jgi:hypothetical protein
MWFLKDDMKVTAHLTTKDEFVVAFPVKEECARAWVRIDTKMHAVLIALVQLGLSRRPAQVAREWREVCSRAPAKQPLATLQPTRPIVQVAFPRTCFEFIQKNPGALFSTGIYVINTIGAKVAEAGLLVCGAKRDGVHAQAAAPLQVLRPVYLRVK